MNPTDKVMLAMAVLVVAGIGVIGAYYLSGMDREPEPIEVTVYYDYGTITPIPMDPGYSWAEYILYTDGCPEGTEYTWDTPLSNPDYLITWEVVDEPVEIHTWYTHDSPSQVPYLRCPGYVFNVVKM